MELMYALISVYRVGFHYYKYRMAGGIKGHSVAANKAIKALENAGKAASTNLMLPKNDNREALLADMEASRQGAHLALTNGEADDQIGFREVDRAHTRR